MFNVFSCARLRTREAKNCVWINVAFPRRSLSEAGLDFFHMPGGGRPSYFELWRCTQMTLAGPHLPMGLDFGGTPFG